jgi:hypothetical protein
VVAFGAPTMMALFLFYLSIAAIVPFGSGLVGFSRRAPIIMTAILIGAFVCLQFATLLDNLKYQSLFPVIFIRSEATAILAMCCFSFSL